MPYIPPEVVTRVREMDLLTYLRTYEPQELVHFGGSTYCTREHDSLKISNGKWCWFSRGIGGYSALDYLIKVKEMPFTQAVETIMGNLSAAPPAFAPAPKTPKEKVLLLPQTNRNATHAVEYPVVASGYRTEQEQQQIYDESMAEYIEKGYSESDAKTETERWVAIPGTSEHQLGLGVDINADGINSYGYEVYNWLAQNAYRYGFIYRYPENKVAITGIANEPWHYRYVGVNAATEIYKRGICLEEYLGETN